MKNTNTFARVALAFALFAFFGVQEIIAQSYDTEEVSMMRGVTKKNKNGWKPDPLFTVNETDNEGTDYSQDRFGYRVPGVFDGMYMYRQGARLNLLVNHELGANRGYVYSLANGTQLTGARVTKFGIKANIFEDPTITSAKLAYHTIYDRYYSKVTNASQINEGNTGSLDGMERLCSANGIERIKYGFRNDIFFTGEETGNGQEFAIDVNNEVMYCVPAMGRAAWEGVCVMDNFHSYNKVVMLIGDDRGGAPLTLYIGEKNASYSPNAPKFLKDNGLAKGSLFVWVADNGDLSPQDWNGTGTERAGKFVKIEHWNPSMAGQNGYDAVGWADQDTQSSAANAVGAFQFSRPEDVATNPYDGSQAVFNSTGLSSLFPADSWGTTYMLDIDDVEMSQALRGSLGNINNIAASIKILYDGDDAGAGQFASPDYGLRSPDNLDWSEDGYIYVNEDRSVSNFCNTSGFEASVWQLNPQNGELVRILEMDRSAVPFMQSDSAPGDCGNWESSGTIDVSRFFFTERDETLLLMDVQAHSISTGNSDLVEGSQILFASKIVSPLSFGHKETLGSNEIENDIEKSNSIIIYPNPTDIEINLSKEASSYKIFNMLGALVLEGGVAKKIDVSSLPAGIYILETDDNNSQKIIIE